MVTVVHGDDVTVAQRLLEEGHDGVATLVGELTGLVGGGGVVGQEGAELGEALGVEQPEVAVLELSDGFDLVEIHRAECTDGGHRRSVAAVLSFGCGAGRTLAS